MAVRTCSFCRRPFGDQALTPLRPEWGDPSPERPLQMLWGCAPCLRKRAERLVLRDEQWAKLSRGRKRRAAA